MSTLPVPAKADPGLSLEEMKQFVRDHFENFVNRKKSEVALRNFSEDFLDHDEPSGPTSGPGAAKRMIEGAYIKWPDLHVTVEDILAEGDKVMVRNTVFGTHRGEFMGIAPTGKQIQQRGFDLFRIAGGKVVEHWGEYDWFGLYQQLGVVPEIGKEKG